MLVRMLRLGAWVVALGMLAGVASAVAQQGCTADAAVAQVKARQGELLKQLVDGQSTEIPQALRTQLNGFKAALAAAVDAGVGCVAAGSDAATMQQSLARLLGANQPEKPFVASKGVPESGIYGAELKVVVSTPANAAALRAIDVSYGIECGDDHMLFMYEAKPTGWQRVLVWQSGEYEEVSGAFGDWLLYSVIPGTASGDLRVAVAHGTAWCISRFSGFKVDLLAPRANGAVPRVAWHYGQGYVRETDPRMTTRAEGFEMRLDVATIESDQMVRKGIFRYKVVSDTVQRIRPIAVDGRGFVDEWLQSPWSEAKQWSLAEGLPTFAKVHEAFERGRKDASVLYSYGPVRACQMKNRYLVEMDAEPGGSEFYTIESGPDSYTLVDYSTVQDERCSGPDLMKKR